MSICFYEGYLRNRLSLCRELGLPDPSGERAVLEAGFRRWGAGLPDHLYGAFAFVFRLPESGAFFAARDPLGLQPFFYYVTEDSALLFASDVNDLLRDRRVRRAVDPEALQHYMHFGYPVGEKTLWQGIRKLLPGRTLTFRDGEACISAYWKPAFHPDDSRSEEAWAADIDETLRLILSEDRENFDFRSAFSFLSGGVDSAYLLAHSGVRRAVGIGYPGEPVSELPLAAKVAQTLGADFSGVEVNPEVFFDAVPRVVRRLGLPLADASAVAFALGCEQAAQTGTVCFSGEGADEFFAGYRIYRRADELAQSGGPWHYGCAGVMEAEDAAPLLKQERIFPCESLVKELYADSEADEHLSRLLRIDCALWLEGDILFGVASSARAAGLRLLLPYADRRLFELSARIPSSLKRKDGVEKYILRRAAETRLPRETAFRPKVGFSVPVRGWLRREPFRSRAESILFGARSSRLFDQTLLRRYWSAFQDGNDAVWQISYAAYVLLVWLREFDI